MAAAQSTSMGMGFSDRYKHLPRLWSKAGEGFAVLLLIMLCPYQQGNHVYKA